MQSFFLIILCLFRKVSVFAPKHDFYREGEVLHQDTQGSTMEVTARVPTPLLGRLRARKTLEITEVVGSR